MAAHARCPIQPMKILYHHRVASKEGQYIHIEEILKALRKAGHDIVMVTPRIGESSGVGKGSGFVRRLKQALPRSVYETVEFAYSLWIFLKLARTITVHRPEFIYERYNLFTPAGIWARKVFRIPLLLEINAPLFEERSKYEGVSLNRLARWTERYTWRNATMVLPVTDVLADHQRRAGVPDERICVIPNGVNLDDFPDPGNDSPGSPAGPERLVLGFVGFCREWHGLHKVIDLLALAGNESLFFLLIGDGPAVEEILASGRRLGVEDRIRVTGHVDRQQVPGLLAEVDIALQPAVVDYASPLKMLEYMATGKAIVAPGQPNIEELLTDGENALLFDPGSQDSFVQACKRLIDDSALRERLSRRARADVLSRGLTWDNNAEKIVTLARNFVTEAA